MKNIKSALILIVTIASVNISYAQTIKIKASGACGMCKDRIEEAALNTIGVNSATWSSKTQILKVEYSGLFQEMELHQAIADVGHDTEKVKAKESIYAALPDCCLYRPLKLDIFGVIVEEDAKGKKIPLIGANLYWEGTSISAATDDKGAFNMPTIDESNKLIISYVGYRNDTLEVLKGGQVEITMRPNSTLDEVEIVRRRNTTSVSYISTIKVSKISEKELQKAACCNLSESFETNPSVDVSFTDAVTGTRTIEMLGLAGPYVQITKDLIPDIRGLAALNGFTYIPGPWVKSMQMNLGAGSVLNGFESIAGQINVEMKKPTDDEMLYLNGYINNGARAETNVIANRRLNEAWTTNGMAHYSYMSHANDRNGDGFLDMPGGTLLSLSNNWDFNNGNNEGQFGFKYIKNNQEGGQNHNTFDHSSGDIWTAQNNANRYEFWMKRGKIFTSRPQTSIGFQLGSVYHDQKNLFGKTIYNGSQASIYANLLYQTILGDTDNKIVFGSSFVLDRFDERINSTIYERREYIPGVFSEYTKKIGTKFDVVLGMRLDYHNQFGLFATPRVHTRYAINETNILRASLGRGQRTASIFAENIGAFASNRKWIIQGEENKANTPYGLNPEVAWNFGLNYTKDINIGANTITWGLDYFLTRFENQIVIDYDKNPQEVNIGNLDGISRSHAVQTQLDFTLASGFDIRAAYRYNNVRTTFHGNVLEKQLISPHRAFINIGYTTKSNWLFDLTVNRQSSKRLPSTESNPIEFRRGDRSPAFSLVNGQVTKKFANKLEIYLGGGSIFDLRQDNPIISPDNPNSAFFDASMVWGPIFGRIVYLGFRYNLLRGE